MPLMLLLIAREIQSLLLILSLFAPDVNLEYLLKIRNSVGTSRSHMECVNLACPISNEM